MSLMITMFLGLVGSIVGGVISAFLFGYDPADPGIHPAGLIMSTIGAALTLLIYLKAVNSSPSDRLPRA